MKKSNRKSKPVGLFVFTVWQAPETMQRRMEWRPLITPLLPVGIVHAFAVYGSVSAAAVAGVRLRAARAAPLRFMPAPLSLAACGSTVGTVAAAPAAIAAATLMPRNVHHRHNQPERNGPQQQPGRKVHLLTPQTAKADSPPERSAMRCRTGTAPPPPTSAGPAPA